nr:MAG TPA: hypothetical protein [Bacteriophage sp.]
MFNPTPHFHLQERIASIHNYAVTVLFVER